MIKMYKNILCILAASLVVQSAIIPSAVVDDAEAHLDDLRKATSVELNQAFVNYTVLAKAVDAIALDTKTNDSSDTVIQCVNAAAKDSLEIIFQDLIGLASTFIRRIYEDENQIIFCGQSDDACLNKVIEDIDKNVASIPDEINAIIIADMETLNQQLATIAACANQTYEKWLMREFVQSYSTEEVKLPSDAADDAEAALDNFRLAIINVLNQAALRYDDLSKSIDTTSLNTKGSTLVEIQESSKHILEQVDSITKTHGVKSGQCLGANTHKLKELVNKSYLGDVISCVDEKSNSTIENLYAERTDLIGATLRIVFALEHLIISCGREDVACLNDTETTINKLSVELPESFLRIVDDFENEVKEQIAEIAACKDQTMSKIYTAGGYILTDIQRCIY